MLMHSYLTPSVHCIIQKNPNKHEKITQVTQHSISTASCTFFFVALIFILPCKYSPTITMIPSTRTRCSTQINMFATGISLFEQSVFPYEYICCTEVLYCHVFEILRPWGHLISTVTYSKITFISNRAYLQLFWLKLLRGVIKGNELFYLEN